MKFPSMFGRGKPKPDKDNNNFQDAPGFRMIWERKTLPGPGAMNFAYESLALAAESPIDGAVAQRQQLKVFAPQIYQFQHVPIAGVPIVSGQVIMQALYDPVSGYVNGSPPGVSELVAENIPVERYSPIPNNSPFPSNL